MKLLLSILFILLSTNCYATTYYVDHVSGDDSRGGTTEATAWKHTPGMNLATGVPAANPLVSGDSVLLKCGVSWDALITDSNYPQGHFIIVPTSGVTWGNYGTGALPKLCGSFVSLTWTQVGVTNVYKYTIPAVYYQSNIKGLWWKKSSDSTVVSMTREDGYAAVAQAGFTNWTIATGLSGITGAVEFWQTNVMCVRGTVVSYNDVTGALEITRTTTVGSPSTLTGWRLQIPTDAWMGANLATNGYYASPSYATTGTLYANFGGVDPNTETFTFNTSKQSRVYLTSVNNTTIQGIDASQCGSIIAAYNTTGTTITGCSLHDNETNDPSCTFTGSVIIGYGNTDWTITNNHLYNGCVSLLGDLVDTVKRHGIYVSYNCTNVLINNNYIEDIDSGLGIGCNIGASENRTSNVRIYGNIINDSVQGMNFKGIDDLGVYNNTMYDLHPVDTAFVPSCVNFTDVTSGKFRNNIIHLRAGHDIGSLLTDTGPTSTCVNDGEGAVTTGCLTPKTDISNNLYYSDRTDDYVIQMCNTGNSALTEPNRYRRYHDDDFILFQTAYDTAAIGFTTTPGVVSASNLSLANDSPCIDKGVNIESIFTSLPISGSVWPTNISTANPNYSGSAWDIGAYNFLKVGQILIHPLEGVRFGAFNSNRSETFSFLLQNVGNYTAATMAAITSDMVAVGFDTVMLMVKQYRPDVKVLLYFDLPYTRKENRLFEGEQAEYTAYRVASDPQGAQNTTCDSEGAYLTSVWDSSYPTLCRVLMDITNPAYRAARIADIVEKVATPGTVTATESYNYYNGVYLGCAHDQLFTGVGDDPNNYDGYTVPASIISGWAAATDAFMTELRAALPAHKFIIVDCGGCDYGDTYLDSVTGLRDETVGLSGQTIKSCF